MARPPKAPAVSAESALDPQRLEEAAEAARQLGQLQITAQENAVALAGQLGYEGALTVGGLEEEIRFYQRRSVEAVLELGKRLMLLKTVTAHGGFVESLERLGIERTMAARFMNATAKFSNVASTQLLALPGMNQTKLLELLVLDEGEIEALDQGDTVRGFKLDDIDCMSVSELRRALRGANAEAEATSKLLAEKTTKIGDLAERLAKKESRIAATAPDEVLAEIRSELLAHAISAEASLINQLKPAFAAYVTHLAANSGAIDEYVASTLDQLERVITEIRDEFGIHRNDKPGWA